MIVFTKIKAVSFKNHDFCCLGGGRLKKISRCRGMLAGGWLGERILAWCEGVLWNHGTPPPPPAAKGGKMKFSV